MKKIIIIIFVALFSFVAVVNAEIPEQPNPPKLVNDFANVLGKNEASQLEGALVQFARETSTQIVVVTVADLEDYAPGDYAVRLAEKWGVGQKGKDNGLVILLKPKTRDSRGEVFVATGYGLEGVLPDATVNGTIIDNEMIPHFKQNDYFGGLVSGIKVIMALTSEEYTAEQYQQNVQASSGSSIPFFIIIFVLIFSVFGRGRKGRFYSPGRSLPFWLAMGMMGGGRSHGGSFNNFSSGGGGFGGFGGGGFGGG
ncbi:MAG: TPM domain-containing protein, partial [Bacteroidetes bacterium]|nr:TPM domain-containing protein [Bacteroidota bacterium]